MVFSFEGVAVPELPAWLLSSLSVMVEVEGEREKVLARGPRWVSFSSGVPTCQTRTPATGKGKDEGSPNNILFVSFQDIFLSVRELEGDGRR